MKHWWSCRIVLGALPVLVVSGMLSACSSSSSKGSAQSSQQGATGAASSAYNPNGVIRYPFDFSQGEVAFDPVKATVADTGNVLGQLLDDSLLRPQPDGSLTPALATAASIINPQTISVTLRPGVSFQDGTPLNASAVKFTILRSSHANSVAFPAPIHDVSSIDENGDLGLTIHLSKPDAGAFYPLLANIATMPLSPAAVQRNNPNPVVNPLGAGPFRVKQYTPDQSLVLVKDPAYWDAKDIKLGGIQFVNESATGPATINALKAGAVDVITSNISELAALSGGGIQTSVASSPTSKLYFPLCDSRGPLQDVRVRQALNYGLDRAAINQALTSGRGEPAWSLVPSSSNLYSSELDNYYAYDPSKAKQLLAQAGYANGVTLTIIPGPSTDLQRLALIAQEEWKQIGVNLQFKTSASYVQDVFVRHLADLTDANVVRSGLDAISFLFTPGHLGDLCNYDNPTLDGMINQLSGLASNDPRYIQLWKQAQDFVVQNALDAWAVWVPTVVAYDSNRVGGIQTVFPGVTAYPDFFTAYVKK
jgi:peptide/nickel transport system substrate-binding protein